MSSSERTPGRLIGEAIDTAERVFPGADWLFGKGKVNPDEPLYGFRVFAPGTEDVIAEGEHDDPVECVMQALDPDRRGKALS
ncbi:hypothetical protein [Mesorhizobium silamurunense]|uniref:hypothetical protein n=1 Tax=Mesorhizobium silamurunense TaxID=499528 RepID=UPI00177ED18E|nr:hypothetical protein [Mesorhizobium silamurunense]